MDKDVKQNLSMTCAKFLIRVIYIINMLTIFFNIKQNRGPN